MASIFDNEIKSVDGLTVAELRVRARILNRIVEAHESFYRAIVGKDAEAAEQALEKRTILLDTATYAVRGKTEDKK